MHHFLQGKQYGALALFAIAATTPAQADNWVTVNADGSVTQTEVKSPTTPARDWNQEQASAAARAAAATHATAQSQAAEAQRAASRPIGDSQLQPANKNARDNDSRRDRSRKDDDNKSTLDEKTRRALGAGFIAGRHYPYPYPYGGNHYYYPAQPYAGPISPLPGNQTPAWISSFPLGGYHHGYQPYPHYNYPPYYGHPPVAVPGYSYGVPAYPYPVYPSPAYTNPYGAHYNTPYGYGNGSYNGHSNSTYGGISIGRGGTRVTIGGNRQSTTTTYSTFP